MPTENDLIETYGHESVNTEYRRAEDTLPRDVWETYSAFANTQGGHIILGVSEDRKLGELHVTGVNNPNKLIKDLFDTLDNL